MPWGVPVGIGATALVVMLTVALPSAPAPAAPSDTLSARTPAPTDVRTIFLRDCATCHGADGQKTTRGPKIAGVGRALTDYMLSTGRMPIENPHEKLKRRRP